MNCVLCGVRKPRRQCPGVNGGICSLCCGAEREQSIDCPLDCVYLLEAHRHEKPPLFDPATLPNRDIQVPDAFLEAHEWLLVLTAGAVCEGALRQPGAHDSDIREALDSLIRTFRGLDSGLIVESRPANAFAAFIVEAVRGRFTELRRRMAEAGVTSTLENNTIVGILVFLQRLEFSNNNGRRRGKAFLDFLLRFGAPLGAEAQPEAEQAEPPQVIL